MASLIIDQKSNCEQPVRTRGIARDVPPGTPDNGRGASIRLARGAGHAGATSEKEQQAASVSGRFGTKGTD